MREINKNISSLRDPFKSVIVWLTYLIEKEGLPLILFETFRSGERQEKLLTRGSSRAGPGQSPHNFGLACDFILDTDECPVRKREWPKGSGRYYDDAWDYDTAEAKAAYREFGILAKSIGLIWGGDWKFMDYPHIEMPSWRKHKGS